MAELADKNDCYVRFNEVGTTSASSSGPGCWSECWPSPVLDELAVRQQPPMSDHLLMTIRVSSGSSHTSLELPATPITYSGHRVIPALAQVLKSKLSQISYQILLLTFNLNGFGYS